MQKYSADLHVHTVLSPCGDLDMSPANIVEAAARKRIDILGIADHNHTKHCALIRKMAEQKGIFVLGGAEVTTREEIHCLAFFENNELLEEFQQYLETYLPLINNRPEVFGHQVVVDEEEMIVEEIGPLLISGIEQSLEQVEEKVHSLGGLFIPAHIDRPSFSLMSQLGFIPPGLKADALEISANTTAEQIIGLYPELGSYSFIGNSDAHHPAQIGKRFSRFCMKEISFDEIGKALRKAGGRGVEIVNAPLQ